MLHCAIIPFIGAMKEKKYRNPIPTVDIVIQNDSHALLIVVLPHIGDIIAYQHALHFCQEVYPYRNQNKV